MDLHVHSIYANSSENIKEILEKAQKNNIKYISVTDHDNCDSYYDLEKINLKEIYDGTIIPGIELTTSFNDQRIELLAYGFDDYRIIDKYFKEANDIDWPPIMVDLRQDLLNKFDLLGLKYDESFKSFESKSYLKRYETKIYASLMELNPNLKDVLKNDYCEEPAIFFRKCISNPNSQFYMNYSKYRPKLEDVINFVHSQNGICFLAHPFAYKIPNPEEFIQKLYDYCDSHNCKLDGIETYYSGFTKEQVEYIENFAKERGLLKSGGSDYHGTERENITMGFYLNQSTAIPDSPIDEWPIKIKKFFN